MGDTGHRPALQRLNCQLPLAAAGCPLGPGQGSRQSAREGEPTTLLRPGRPAGCPCHLPAQPGTLLPLVCPLRMARCPSCPLHGPALLSHHVQGTNGAQSSHVTAWGAGPPRAAGDPRLGVRMRRVLGCPGPRRDVVNLGPAQPHASSASRGLTTGRPWAGTACRGTPPFLHSPWHQERFYHTVC